MGGFFGIVFFGLQKRHAFYVPKLTDTKDLPKMADTKDLPPELQKRHAFFRKMEWGGLLQLLIDAGMLARVGGEAAARPRTESVDGNSTEAGQGKLKDLKKVRNA